MSENGIAYWAYSISRHKIIKDLVETGTLYEELADEVLEKLLEQMTESNVAEFRIKGECAEIIRTYLIPDAPRDTYVSLTDIAREQSDGSPGYVIQSWLRSRNTVEFLKIWEKEHNPMFDEDECNEMLEAMKTTAFTLTPKKWISRTNAAGLISKQGKSGGTLAHPDIAVDFHMWVKPELRMNLIRLFRQSVVE